MLAAEAVGDLTIIGLMSLALNVFQTCFLAMLASRKH